MTDKEAIQRAYEDMIAELYKTLFDSYAIAAGDAAEQAKADTAFKRGLRQARLVRDKAVSLL